MIPLGTVASSRVVIPSIDIFMWTAGMNTWPRNSGSVDYSTNVLISSGNTYSINLTVSGSPGVKRARLNNDTTSTTLAITVDNECVYSENSVGISGGAGQSPNLDFLSNSFAGFYLDNPAEPIYVPDLEIDSGGWGVSNSGPGTNSTNPGFYDSMGQGFPPAVFTAGRGGDGIANPYSAVFGPTYVCAGGVGSFYGSSFLGGGVQLTGSLFPYSFIGLPYYEINATNVAHTYSGSGATALNNSQIGTNAGLGAAIVKSTVPLTFGSASHATNGGFHYYFLTTNTTFQMS